MQRYLIEVNGRYDGSSKYADGDRWGFFPSVEVNGRYDGSSKYADGDRWGFFPSVSAGWRISEEPFFEPARNVFDNLKLRASYGGLGNQVTDGNFQYLSYLNSQTLSYLINDSSDIGKYQYHMGKGVYDERRFGLDNVERTLDRII